MTKGDGRINFDFLMFFFRLLVYVRNRKFDTLLPGGIAIFVFRLFTAEQKLHFELIKRYDKSHDKKYSSEISTISMEFVINNKDIYTK